MRLTILGAALCLGWAAAALATPIRFAARDGVSVHGDFTAPAGASRGTILLFHMAGSNLGEYAPIVPRLVAAGFATLAVDARSGGRLWGRDNATAAAVRGQPDYQAALPDLEAALTEARRRGARRVIAWGSSYSAALVFELAARHPEIGAVLAFSPGEYIDGVSIAGAAARVRVPVFVTSAADAGEIAAARAIVATVPGGRGRQQVPRAGVHGSATLRADRNPAGAAANFAAVLAFLDQVAPR
ncbi:hypothetical protein IP88_01545 [alpha proteobacterium AAP81b]|nr:hypothetical protein IP88_01545 [alpha proteobacterium AAP81b]